MVGRDEAIAIALKLAEHDPRGRPIERIGNVFSKDEALTWMVHLVPAPIDLGNGCIAVDSPGTWAVCVSWSDRTRQLGGNAMRTRLTSIE
jgi:hypothetical protein